MNERIRQLAEQAGFFPTELTQVGPSVEKFAESIVMECTKILADNSEFKGCVIIVKHFGVEL